MNAKLMSIRSRERSTGPSSPPLRAKTPNDERHGQRDLEDGDRDVRQPGGVADEVDGHDGGEAAGRVAAEVQRRARVGQPALLAAEVRRDRRGRRAASRRRG